MLSRRMARSLGLQVLFYLDFNKFEKENFDEFYQYLLKDLLDFINKKSDKKIENKDLKNQKDEYSYSLIKKVLENREKIDKLIELIAPEWPIEKISLVSRNILRLAIYELLFVDDVPEIVAINEGIVLSEKFNRTKKEDGFVSAVLAKVYENFKEILEEEGKKDKKEFVNKENLLNKILGKIKKNNEKEKE